MERRYDNDVMVKDRSGKIDLIIIDTPANSKDIAMRAAEQADFVSVVLTSGYNWVLSTHRRNNALRQGRWDPY